MAIAFRMGWALVWLGIIIPFTVSVSRQVASYPDFLRDSFLGRHLWLRLQVAGPAVGLGLGRIQFLLRRLTPAERRRRFLPVHRWFAGFTLSVPYSPAEAGSTCPPKATAVSPVHTHGVLRGRPLVARDHMPISQQ